MTEYNKTPEEEEKMIEDAFNELLQGYINSNHRKKIEIIKRAYAFAKEAHKASDADPVNRIFFTLSLWLELRVRK